MADIYRSDIVPVDLNHALSRKHVGSVLATGDNGANRFGASVLRDGKAVDLTGCAVVGYFMRPGQNALVLEGQTDGHVAYVDLAQACYTMQSSFTLTIKVSGNGITTALRIIDGYILLTQTDELDALTGTVPTLDDIFAQIAAMEQATANANTATQAAQQATEEAQEATQEMMTTSAPAIIPTATGSIVSITDGAARPAVEVISHIAHVETGTGEKGPNNPWVISGWDKVTVKRAKKNILPDGEDERTDYLHNYATDKAFEGAEGKQITVSFDLYSPDGNVVNIYAYQQSGLSIGDSHSVRPDVGVYKRYSFATSIFRYGETMNDGMIAFYSPSMTAYSVKNVQIEFGTTATAYEPYQGQTLTANLPETVYGGTLDWTTGVLTVDRAFVDLGDYIWSYYTNYDHPVFRTTDVSATLVNTGDNICTHYNVFGSNLTDVVDNNNSVCVVGNRIWVRDDRFTDAAGFKAAVTGVKMAAMLANPYTIQLTPQQLDTLQGTNNVWSSTGDTTLSYVADTQMYIDNKLAAIAAATLNA